MRGFTFIFISFCYGDGFTVLSGFFWSICQYFGRNGNNRVIVTVPVKIMGKCISFRPQFIKNWRSSWYLDYIVFIISFTAAIIANWTNTSLPFIYILPTVLVYLVGKIHFVQQYPATARNRNVWRKSIMKYCLWSIFTLQIPLLNLNGTKTSICLLVSQQRFV